MGVWGGGGGGGHAPGTIFKLASKHEVFQPIPWHTLEKEITSCRGRTTY